MKKIAFIPWDSSIHDDNIYCPRDDWYVDSHILLSRYLKTKGAEIHTIDMYKDLNEIDCFLFSKLEYEWMVKVAGIKAMDKAVYWSAEPPVVVGVNCREGYEQILKYFGNVMTWNPDLVDNKRIFLRNIPYMFVKYYGDSSENAFRNKKLMTNISGDKSSDHPKEMYSEREKVITWFEKNHPDEFDLYGFGWNADKHPSYKGTVNSKFDTYHKYKFALCLENMKDVKGYITEKICDCLTAGIVPVYYGASDISKYVPEDCYIDYSQFDSLDDMYQFLNDMSYDRYMEYINCIDRYLDNPAYEPFNEEFLGDAILKVINDGYHEQMTIPLMTYMQWKMKATKEVLSRMIMNARIKLGEIRHGRKA